ncbi:hypothetical protein DM450_0110 [Sphingomonas sp. IC081]|nr:hypothetical protein DM450_0110 [Sphingomonas sp. IC081]
MTTPSFARPKRSRKPPRTPRPERPETVASFIEKALAAPMAPPPPPAAKPRSPNRKAGIWDKLKTPEERSAYAKELASRRDPKNMARKGRFHGTPVGWDHRSAAVAKTAARLEADALVSTLQARGVIAPDDTEGAEATIEALTIVRSPGGMSKRKKWAKRLLTHYHPELAGNAGL